MSYQATRRGLLAAGAATLGAAALSGGAAAQPKTGLPIADRLDGQVYIRNMALHAHYFPGQVCGSKLQMMAQGDRRYLFSSYRDAQNEWVGRCIDVTDPLNAVVVGDHLYEGYQVQVAYNRGIGKWVLMTSATAAEPQIDLTRGKNLKAKGLRGIRLYDVTEPGKARLLSEWSTDRGDPRREIQEGTGTHRNFYTGGRYAYLDTGADNTFSLYEYARATGVQVIDILDPARPKFVSNIWVPGQRAGEEAEHRKWPFAGNGISIPSLHGSYVVPENVEDGGKLGWGAWSVLGVRVHDLSKIARPREIGVWTSPDPDGGGLKLHTVDVSRLDRGFVVASPETFALQCGDAWYNSYVIDARDPAKLKTLSTLPIPTPPPGAPYESFCQKRGRFGPHNAPHQKAPGTVSPSFTCYTFFNAGLQCYDLADPSNPRITGYFIPPQGGALDRPGSYIRDTDGVFVEWDRRLIWVSTSTGVYLLTTPALGEASFSPAGVRGWTLPALRHWPTA
ncbi:hypothetical protein [Phenylobacterium sp.]|uniref:LVIVD repeat-containing protein n=1 Tax=Phenylobacterium sp. TaxID=1871053 RepID=UPI002811B024|nr:hypothetical protein [Phenylobacterium sp.]